MLPQNLWVNRESVRSAGRRQPRARGWAEEPYAVACSSTRMLSRCSGSMRSPKDATRGCVKRLSISFRLFGNRSIFERPGFRHAHDDIGFGGPVWRGDTPGGSPQELLSTSFDFRTTFEARAEGAEARSGKLSHLPEPKLTQILLTNRTPTEVP